MNKQDNLKKNILDKINKGDIKMKPKIYFTFKTVLVWAVIVATVVVMSFFVSFVIFGIKESSKLFLLGFGSAGIRTFFVAFPWLLLVLEIALLFAVDVLLKRFKFAYRTPFIYLILSTVILVMFTSIFISSTPLHETLYQEVVEQKIPVLEAMYLNVKRPPSEKGVFRGIITNIDDDMFTIYNDDKDKDEDDGYRTIFIPKDQSKYTSSVIKVGDFVLAACSQEENGRCYVYGLKNLKQNSKVK